MNSLILIVLLVINLGISYWNARVCGKVWNDAKALGGWLKLVVWSGAIQSAVGFSSVLLAILGYGAHVAGYLPAKAAHGMLSLWYLLVIIPVLMSGWIITVQSWISLARDRSLMNMASTGWNTYASISNTVDAFTSIGGAVKGVKNLFSEVDDDSSAPGLAIVVAAVGLVLCSVFGGALLTACIIQANKGTLPAPVKN